MTPAIAALRDAGIAHDVLEYAHDPRSASYGLEAAEALGVPAATVFKTLVAATEDGRLVIGCVPVDRQLDLKALAAATGAKRCEMAEVAAAERATGYVAGGISPLGQKRRLAIVVDASVLALSKVHVSAGRRGLEVRLSPADLLRAAGATTATIAR
ncbi:MAG: Cys-tRNA(Pro)/Cys-tRNA(Cys) deacylase [Acidobacteriota bacterium]